MIIRVIGRRDMLVNAVLDRSNSADDVTNNDVTHSVVMTTKQVKVVDDADDGVSGAVVRFRIDSETQQ